MVHRHQDVCVCVCGFQFCVKVHFFLNALKIWRDDPLPTATSDIQQPPPPPTPMKTGNQPQNYRIPHMVERKTSQYNKIKRQKYISNLVEF